MGVEQRLTEIEKRLDRLERLAFLGFQDTRDVAEYAYQSVFEEPETAKRLSWTKPSLHTLSDEEAIKAGLALYELAALKKTMRILRHQTRHDVLGIIRDLVRSGRKEQMSEERAPKEKVA